MLPLRDFAIFSFLCHLGTSVAAPQAPRPPQQQWQNLTNLPRFRQEHSAAALDENTIALVGGVTRLGDLDLQTGLETVNWVELYDIPSDTWREVAPAPLKVNHPNVAVVDGKLYLLGGLVEAQDPPTPEPDWVASGESHVYDPASDTWAELPAMPAGTERGSAILGVHCNTIYVAGGMTYLKPGDQDAVSTVTAFDTKTLTWKTLLSAATNIPEGRQHGVGAVANDIFYVVGGRWMNKENVRGTVFMLDLKNQGEGWTTSAAQMPVPRGGLSGAVVDGNFYTFGGESNPDTENGIFDEVEVFNLARQEWTSLGPMAVPRHGSFAVSVGNKVYIPGGGLQEDGKAIFIGDEVHILDTTDHFDAFVV